MRKAFWAGACAVVGLLALDSLCWWGGVRFLEYRLASAALGEKTGQRSGCSVAFEKRERGGWPFHARLRLGSVQISCGAGLGLQPDAVLDNARLFYAAHEVSVEVAPWHPLIVRGTLAGGQSVAALLEEPARQTAHRALLFRLEGAPVQVSLPLLAGQSGVLHFSADFVHLLPQRGVAEAHPVTAQGLSGRLVWNSQADAQASAVALSLTARRAVTAPWAESVEDVQGALSIPGPASRISALWVQGEPSRSAQPLSPAREPESMDLLVQHLSGRWRGLGVSWSGRLVMAPGALPLGETWLTLSGWRPFLACLQQDKTLRPEQTVLLSRLTDQLDQRTGGTEGPLSVPLQVRDGAVQLGGVPLLSVIATLHTLSLTAGVASGPSGP